MPVYLNNKNNKFHGEGIFFDILRSGAALYKSSELYNDRPGYPEEKHGVFIDEGPYKNKKALFLGPGTNLEKRLQRGDDKVKMSKLDKSALEHDKAYVKNKKQLDNKEIDKIEFISNIHSADEKFINDASKNTETPRTAKISSEAMKTKMFLEKKGILPTTIFSGGEIHTESKEYMDAQKKICYPCDILLGQIKGKQQKGGLGPLMIALLSILAEKSITMISNALNKQEGSGIMEVSKELSRLPENKQFKIVNDVIRKLKSEAFD